MSNSEKQRIMVFQQNGSGETKIRGIREYGRDRFDLRVVNIDESLPEVIDEAGPYLPESLEADLVLDYLRHPDLSYELAERCRDLGIPVVASGRKIRVKGTLTPPTCCGLARNERTGLYGEAFGAPEFDARVQDGKVVEIRVLRGAPCGASWEAARRVQGLSVEEAVVRIGLDVQFYCTADPAGWDPIYGKSPVHFAGDVHSAALKRALRRDSEDD
ncbi:MAG: DUF166 domain-containing protein [Desulfobacterales bacterium]|nr:DUF166 domain-containing protein [Desulfobacterales bacterium]